MEKIPREQHGELEGGSIIATAQSLVILAGSTLALFQAATSQGGTLKMSKDQSISWSNKDQNYKIVLPRLYDA